MRPIRDRAPGAALLPLACLLLAVALAACGQAETGGGGPGAATSEPASVEEVSESPPAASPAIATAPPRAVATVPAGDASGPGRADPDEGGGHVPEGTAVDYANEPPTSGRHYPVWAEYGVYQEAITAPYFVHNLEHGAIVVLYRCPDGGETCPEVVSRLEEVYAAAPPGKYGAVKMVVTRYPNLETPYAVLAWNRSLPLQELDQEAILEFYRAWVDKGPEDVP